MARRLFGGELLWKWQIFSWHYTVCACRDQPIPRHSGIHADLRQHMGRISLKFTLSYRIFFVSVVVFGFQIARESRFFLSKSLILLKWKVIHFHSVKCSFLHLVVIDRYVQCSMTLTTYSRNTWILILVDIMPESCLSGI